MRTLARRHVPWLFVCPLLVAVVSGCTPLKKGSESFTVVLLPDTQYYSEQFPETYMAQTQWIASRAKEDNIRFVIHLGDITDTPGAENEWQVADRAHKVLDGVVPYSVTLGNHDYDRGSKEKRPATLFDKYFPPSRFKKYRWYGGHMGQSNANNYCFFEGGGKKFMVVSLEFAPSDAIIAWASGVINAHKDRQVIVATHYYLRPEGRPSEGSPKGFDGHVGDELWNRLIRKHENIFMVVSGHVVGVRHQTSTNDAGRPVLEILADYQGLPNGGDGWLVTLRFVPEENKIHVQTYSPTLKRTYDNPNFSYTLDYEMGVRPLKKAG